MMRSSSSKKIKLPNREDEQASEDAIENIITVDFPSVFSNIPHQKQLPYLNFSNKPVDSNSENDTSSVVGSNTIENPNQNLSSIDNNNEQNKINNNHNESNNESCSSNSFGNSINDNNSIKNNINVNNSNIIGMNNSNMINMNNNSMTSGSSIYNNNNNNMNASSFYPASNFSLPLNYMMMYQNGIMSIPFGSGALPSQVSEDTNFSSAPLPTNVFPSPSMDMTNPSLHPYMNQQLLNQMLMFGNFGMIPFMNNNFNYPGGGMNNSFFSPPMPTSFENNVNNEGQITLNSNNSPDFVNTDKLNLLVNTLLEKSSEEKNNYFSSGSNNNDANKGNHYQEYNSKPRQSSSSSLTKLNKRFEDNDTPFLNTLRKLIVASKTKLSRIPVVGGKLLDLETLFILVQQHGGLDNVTRALMWRSVAMRMEIPVACTSAGHLLRRYYTNLMLPYEDDLLKFVNSNEATKNALLMRDSPKSSYSEGKEEVDIGIAPSFNQQYECESEQSSSVSGSRKRKTCDLDTEV